MNHKHTASFVNIRAANADDAAAIAQMACALEAEVGGEGLATAEKIIEAMERVNFWVACKPSIPVAFAMHYEGYDLASATHGTHLGDIYVQPEYRGCGVGRALMAHIADATLSAGGEWVSFTVVNENKEALKFYEALHAQEAPVHFMAMGRGGLEGLS